MVIRKNYAFTLAEVIITIGIIGVVSVLTIPTLIQNANSRRFVNQFKKSLSTLSQAAVGAQAQYDMNYSLLSLNSSDSNCANDTLAAGQYNMCGLFNNTLSAKMYQGKYGNVKGMDSTSIYNAAVTSFPIENFLVFSFADGAFVAFNPDAKACEIEPGHTLTTEIITDGKLKNCLGFIDVNGPNPPNTEVKCATDNTKIAIGSTCELTSPAVGDIFPIVFYDTSVTPATNASLAAFLSSERKKNQGNYNNNDNIAPIKKAQFKGKEYELKNGKYVTEDTNGNYIDGLGNVYTKNSDGNYQASDGYVYDKDMNTIGRYYKGNWFDYKGDVLVRPIGNNTYKGQGGMTYTPNSNGGYNRSDGAVLDSNFNLIGQNKNNSWYNYKNGFFVKENTNGDYVDSSGKVYAKSSDGYYVNSNIYYDKDMNPVKEYYNGNWFEYHNGLFVRKTGESTYKGHSMTYTKNDDGYYVRSDKNVYDDEFNLIGK